MAIMGKASGWVLVAVCFSAMTDAFNMDRVQTMINDYYSSEIDVQTVQLEEAMATLEKLQQLLDTMKENGGKCSCKGLNCQCCLDIKVRGFRAKFCLSLSFNPLAGTATITGTINGHTAFTRTFQVSKPIPPPCFRYEAATICLELYDFRLTQKTFNGCARISLKIHRSKFSIKVGCFQLNFLDASAATPLSFSRTPVVEAATVIDSYEENSYEEMEDFGKEGQSVDDGNGN